MSHFRCPICQRIKVSTKSLSSHMSTAHKEVLEKVPNAVAGRDSPNNTVFGMKGIPENVYVGWLTSVDPDFKEHAKDVSLEGAVFASDATRFAAMTHMAARNNITYGQFNQFQKAAVQVNQGLGTVLTARGVVATDALQKQESRVALDDPSAAQRKYEIAMRRAQELIDEAMDKSLRDRAEKVKKQKRQEEMYFTPENGLSVHEMRALYLMQKGNM